MRERETGGVGEEWHGDGGHGDGGHRHGRHPYRSD